MNCATRVNTRTHTDTVRRLTGDILLAQPAELKQFKVCLVFFNENLHVKFNTVHLNAVSCCVCCKASLVRFISLFAIDFNLYTAGLA